MLEKLKQIAGNLDRLLNNDEAVSLSAYARSLSAEYEELGIPAPEWLDKSIVALREEIARRTHEADLAELRRVEAEIESLKTTNERRNDATARLAQLQKKLGLGKVAATSRR